MNTIDTFSYKVRIESGRKIADGPTESVAIPALRLTKDQAKRIRTWIRALASGEFRQAREVLFTGKAYCCLGVGCELYSWKVGGFWLHDGSDEIHFVADYRPWHEDDEDDSCAISDSSTLPPPVSDWYGTRGIESALIVLNDAGVPFIEIAKYLRLVLKRAAIYEHDRPLGSAA